MRWGLGPLYVPRAAFPRAHPPAQLHDEDGAVGGAEVAEVVPPVGSGQVPVGGQAG